MVSVVFHYKNINCCGFFRAQNGRHFPRNIGILTEHCAGESMYTFHEVILHQRHLPMPYVTSALWMSRSCTAFGE
jgi:hypothetical protein